MFEGGSLRHLSSVPQNTGITGGMEGVTDYEITERPLQESYEDDRRSVVGKQRGQRVFPWLSSTQGGSGSARGGTPSSNVRVPAPQPSMPQKSGPTFAPAQSPPPSIFPDIPEKTAGEDSDVQLEAVVSLHTYNSDRLLLIRKGVLNKTQRLILIQSTAKLATPVDKVMAAIILSEDPRNLRETISNFSDAEMNAFNAHKQVPEQNVIPADAFVNDWSAIRANNVTLYKITL
jgi:hypothetical protein